MTIDQTVLTMPAKFVGLFVIRFVEAEFAVVASLPTVASETNLGAVVFKLTAELGHRLARTANVYLTDKSGGPMFEFAFSCAQGVPNDALIERQPPPGPAKVSAVCCWDGSQGVIFGNWSIPK